MFSLFDNNDDYKNFDLFLSIGFKGTEELLHGIIGINKEALTCKLIFLAIKFVFSLHTT